MTMKRIFYTRPDGGVSVVCPAPEFMARFESEAEGIDAVRAKDVPADAANIWEGDVGDLPHRGSFRNAWKQTDATAPEVDMPKARAIKTDRIRPERNERLAALDIDYMRADEAGDTTEKERVAVVKQELRDLPATIQPDLDAIDQPEELEVYEPTWPTAPE